jgi:hypothetical protein
MYKRPEYTKIVLDNNEKLVEGLDVEFILIDDGNTKEYFDDAIAPFYIRNKKRCQLITHKKNEGLRNSVIDGIYRCRGKYVHKIDNDFIIKKGWLQHGMSILDTDNIDIIAPAHQLRQDYLNKESPEIYSEGFYVCNFIGGNWFINRDHLKDQLFSKTFQEGEMALFDSSFLHLRDFNVSRFGETTDLWAEHIADFTEKHDLFIASDDHKAYYKEIGRLKRMIHFK